MGMFFKLLSNNRFVVAFVAFHIMFAMFLGRLFALAPDEGGYLYTFTYLYGHRYTDPQFYSGWITAPKFFLWVTHLPAKLLVQVGVPDYLALRLLSIALITASLILLINLQRRTSFASNTIEKYIFLFFLIPSVFLWTSVGLREAFIIAEFTLILVGSNYFFASQKTRGLIYIAVGSYGLMSTKNYLWVCLVASVLVVWLNSSIRRSKKQYFGKLFIGLILLPSILFASTTSVYALKFFISSVFHTDVTGTGARSGDSVLQVAIPADEVGGTGSGGTLNSDGSTSSKPAATVITFHGDTTLILLHFYLIDHPKSLFTKVLSATGIKRKLDEIWVTKIKQGLVKKSVAALPDSSSLSGYILKPGSLHEPLSIVRPAFLFLFGPIPLIDQGGLALNVVSFESPLWWLLYVVVGIQFLRYGRRRFAGDQVLIMSMTFFTALVVFSSLVEVNLGTSFRHRSILLVPLLMIFIRSRAKPVSVNN